MSVFDNAELLFSLAQEAQIHAVSNPTDTPSQRRLATQRPWGLPFEVDGKAMVLTVDEGDIAETINERLREYSIRIYIEKLFDVVITYNVNDNFIQTEALKSKRIIYQCVSDEEIEHYFVLIRLQYGE